jgi:hypothetical protein
MLLDVGEQDFDSRSRTIEMISKKAIDLNHSLFAVICPKSFRRANTELLAAFKARGVFIHEYEVFYGDVPESYNTIIKTILFELYKQNNVL